MYQINTIIQGLSFIQVDILGCYLPSSTSIESVLNGIKDKRKKRKICDFSNSLVQGMGERWVTPLPLLREIYIGMWIEYVHTDNRSLEQLDKLLSMVIADQCELSGHSYNDVMQNMFVKAWLESMIGDSNYDIQKLERLAGRWLKSYVDSDGSVDVDIEIKPETISQRMMNYPEYVNSRRFSESFDFKIYQIAHLDELMAFLIAVNIDVMHARFSLIGKAESITYRNFCSKCQTHFESPKMPKLRVCPSCLKESRGQKKASRRKYPKGEFNLFGNCKHCENKRKLNADGFCREHSE